MDPRTPIFDLDDHFDVDVPIGDKRLPVHVKRFARAEMDAFEKKWQALIEPRGTSTLSEAEKQEREAQQLRFFEDSIRDAITLDEGLLRDRGKWVTDGAGIIGVFHARTDVLGEFLGRIYAQNKLSAYIRKNSSLPPDSGTGSDVSSQARGGDRPDSIAASAASSSSAPSAAATGVSDPPDLENGATPPDPASSGAKVH
jgi:hypothetical protein